MSEVLAGFETSHRCLLRGPHGPPEVNGSAPLAEDEIRDLAAFLRSL